MKLTITITIIKIYYFINLINKQNNYSGYKNIIYLFFQNQTNFMEN